ncbi:NAD(P)-dependent alcohol dehydrogenase [Maritalea mediterranea]|uniref:NAD(P)-dependent alcohol dehydrogenase n=1 Tax=Maritalea mediterranea TaxID=2909667 RepID=A0ABS9EDY6_9HYPH|nr:NAD(P)-dependent alcohol dehydrogenase [Maritalea mediterranea]MCF4099661.1 NAD(P)-dependent alcohol dehydrogenase [Maritalea mediterranea]
MKAYICEKYGAADNLQLKDIEIPTPAPDEILIKVHATSLNSWDWDKLRGHVFTRFENIKVPAHPILGGDVAGVVAHVGDQVTQFAVGDRVFGDLSQSGWGAFAEYVCGKAENMAKIPEGVSDEEAATLPQAGLLALQATRMGNIQPCMHVLINGAGGGAGMFAVQLAKLQGAVVHAVDRAEKQEAMHAFGADHTYDFKATDFSRLEQKFDVVIDMVARRRPAKCYDALKPHGHYIVVGGNAFMLLRLFLASRKTREDGKKISILAWDNASDQMTEMAELVRDKKIRCFIEQIYPFEHLKGAMAAQSEMLAKGKHVVRMVPDGARYLPYPEAS